MITANKDTTKIGGMNIDIIFEFNSIIRALQEENPEIVLGTLTAWSSILEEKLGTVNKTKLAFVTHISEDFVELHNESEDDNG